MSKKQFTLQYAGRPMGVTGNADPRWKKLSAHTTRRAAFSAQRRAVAEMDRRCGPNAWDDHYRVIDQAGNVITETATAWVARVRKSYLPA